MDKSCLLYQCLPKERELEENCHIAKMDEPQEEDGHHNEMDRKACAESNNFSCIQYHGNHLHGVMFYDIRTVN